MKALFFTLLLAFVYYFSFTQSLAFEQLNIASLSAPLEITHTGMATDSRLFVCERGGNIRIINDVTGNNPTLLANPFMTVPGINQNGEGGLLGLAFDPDYKNNGFFYVQYTDFVGPTFTSRISRFTRSSNDSLDNSANVGTELVILEIAQPYTNHNGGDLEFGHDGMLYIPMGDGGDGNDPDNNGQDSSTLLGSILRIDVSNSMVGNPYDIPNGNPFTSNPNVPDEIWSTGWRNPWRFSFDRMTGHMYVGDVGQGQREEISIEAAGDNTGRNYGWRCMEGNRVTNLPGCPPSAPYTNPKYEYAHSSTPDGRGSVTGGMVYRGIDYPSLYGKYLFTDYRNSEVFWILTMNDTSVMSVDTQLFTSPNALSSVVAIGDDIDGELYAAEIGSGNIYKITASVVPVTLLSFSGLYNESSVLLEWTVADEYNMEKYVVERSSGGKIFQEIGSVQSKAEKLFNGVYHFEDKDLHPVNYYRLKMIDLDGTLKYSDVIKVNALESIAKFYQFSPNPSAGIFNLTTNGILSSEIDLKVYDSKGSLIYTGNDANTVNLSHCSKGIYYAQITFEGIIEMHRLVIH